MFVSRRSKFILVFVLAFGLIIGLILLVLFPLTIFPAIVKGMLQLKANADGSYPRLTYYWSKPPAISYHNFYMWNMTNIEEFVFYGEKAIVRDIGPYSFVENEFKGPIEFSDDGESVYFQNNRSWVYNQDTSCELCTYDDYFYLPNPALMAIAGLMEKYFDNTTNAQRVIVDVGSLMLGSYPFAKVRMRDVLFEGYNDNLVDFLHSDFYKTLESIVAKKGLCIDLNESEKSKTAEEGKFQFADQEVCLNGSIFGFPIPDLPPKLGYFPSYNWSVDEDYWVDTGKSNYKNIAKIEKWAGSSELSWWHDDVANDLVDSVDGVVNGAFLNKDEPLKFFQSYACRHFEIDFVEKSTVNGIDAYLYTFNSNNFNPYVEKFKGFRYENFENANYAPRWPSCPNKRNDLDCKNINCTQFENLCSSCCNGSNVDGHFLFPPGIVQQICYPGRNKKLPFSALLSPPHFYGSPKEVVETIDGVNPNEEDHSMGEFYIQPMIGSSINANFRLQLSIPVYQMNTQFKLSVLSTLKSTIIPCFWLNDRVSLKDYAHDYIKLATVTIPNIILGIGIGLTAISIILAILFILLLWQQRKRENLHVLSEDKKTDNILT